MYCSTSLNISTASFFCCLSRVRIIGCLIGSWEDGREKGRRIGRGRERDREREREREEVKEGEGWRKRRGRERNGGERRNATVRR